MSVKKPDTPMLPPKVSVKNAITLQVKQTFSGKAYIRVVPNLEWVYCHNDLTPMLIPHAQRVLPFEGVSNLTTCWELPLIAKHTTVSTKAILDYASKVAPRQVYPYLYEAVSYAAEEIRDKKYRALASPANTYPTYKERGNV